MKCGDLAPGREVHHKARVMNRAVVRDGVPREVSHATAQHNNVVLWRQGWERWKQIARAVGVVQTKFIMILFYFVMVLPLGLVVRLREDRLRLRPPQGSLWVPHSQEEHTLDRARKQY